ncbi:lens epithelium-derived growth factor [Diabrotica virgifera virgifera]|uniref:Uncharacterized protein n=1 Tax=Diabrotica virgifera virgifera TaxID=50390 RepID=A0ABM5IBH4_DIAVI|nr:lens epithelium-derived growth factor [Diabrotica virgifera virgifera]
MLFSVNRSKTNKLLYVVTLNNSHNGIWNSPHTSITCKNSSHHYRNYSKEDASPTKGKIAIITGDARGIGLSIAEQLLKAEAEAVVIGDVLTQATENETFWLNEKYGEHKVLFEPTDVTNPKHMEKLFNFTNKRFGNIGIVVNNAGVLSNQNQEQIVDDNIKSLVNGTLLAFQYMSGKGGIIINNASLEALQPMYTSPFYSGASHFIIGFTRSMSHNYFYNATGVKVMAFCPGPRETPMLSDIGIDNNINELMFYNLRNKLEIISTEDFIPMSETVAKGVISMLHDGENGSIWISKNCKFNKIQVPDFKNLTPAEIKTSQKSSTKEILSATAPKSQTRNFSSNTSKTDTPSNPNKSLDCKSSTGGSGGGSQGKSDSQKNTNKSNAKPEGGSQCKSDSKKNTNKGKPNPGGGSQCKSDSQKNINKSKPNPGGGSQCKSDSEKNTKKSTKKVCIKFGDPKKRKIICKKNKHMCEKLKERKKDNNKLPCVLNSCPPASQDKAEAPKCSAANKKQKGSEKKPSKKYKKDKCENLDPCKSKKKKKGEKEKGDKSKDKCENLDPCKSKKKKEGEKEKGDKSKDKCENVDPCKSKKKKKGEKEKDDKSKDKSDTKCKNDSKGTNEKHRRKMCAPETEIWEAKRNYSVCKKSDKCGDNEQQNEKPKVSVDLKPFCSLKESNYQKRVTQFKCDNVCSKADGSNIKWGIKTESTEIVKENCQNQTEKSNLESTANLANINKTAADTEINPELQKEPIMSTVLSNIKDTGLNSSLNETSKSQILVDTKSADVPKVTLVNHIDVGETIGLIPTLALATETPENIQISKNVSSKQTSNSKKEESSAADVPQVKIEDKKKTEKKKNKTIFVSGEDLKHIVKKLE